MARTITVVAIDGLEFAMNRYKMARSWQERCWGEEMYDDAGARTSPHDKALEIERASCDREIASCLQSIGWHFMAQCGQKQS